MACWGRTNTDLAMPATWVWDLPTQTLGWCPLSTVRAWVSKSTQVPELAQGSLLPLLQTRELWHHLSAGLSSVARVPP